MARQKLSRADALARLNILLDRLHACAAAGPSAKVLIQVLRSFLLDEIETSLLTHLSVKTLQAMRLQGRGPRFRKLGKAVRYSLGDVLDYIEKSGRNSTGEAA